MDRATFTQNLTEFLIGLDDDPSEDLRFGPGDNLFDEGVVTSISVVRMISHVEELIGTRIDLAQHSIERFFTLDSIYDLATEIGAVRADA